MVVTGVVMVLIVVMMMACESRHGDHDHRDEKQWQQHLFHGRIIAANRKLPASARQKEPHLATETRRAG
jgi:hypothetical protein